MTTTHSLKRTHIANPHHSTQQNPARYNLSNRFSAGPLKDISIHQNFQRSKIAKPSAYERNIQIAKAAAAVVGLAVIIFAAYCYPSKPISCRDLGNNLNGKMPKCTLDKGSMYEGEWENNQFSGPGLYTFKDGSTYKGFFEEDSFSGNGSYTSLLRYTFSGRFKDDKLIHEGRLIELGELDQCKPESLTNCVVSLRNKDCETIDPACSGTVDCTFDDGAKYQGSVAEGKFSGNGSYTSLLGHIFSGPFKDDKLIHEGRLIKLGELDQCKPESLTNCVVSLRNKDCETIDPAYSGTVDCTFDDGAKYQGSVAEGKFSGNGSYTSLLGHIFSGPFKEDKLILGEHPVQLSDLDLLTVNHLIQLITTNMLIDFFKQFEKHA